jgi:hypothetical protein
MRKADINAEFAKIMQKWRRKGGRNSVRSRFAGMSREQISARMRAVNAARWAKKPRAAA